MEGVYLYSFQVKLLMNLSFFPFRFSLAFAVFFSSNLVLTLVSTLVTACIAPAAAGSGIPEVKAYLNGVDAPGIFTIKTLFVKVYSVF